MSLSQAMAASMAELLRVDEVTSVSLLRPALGFALRIGRVWSGVIEIDQPSVLMGTDPKAALDCISRALFRAADELRGRVEAFERDRAYASWILDAQAQVMGTFGMPSELLVDPPRAAPRMNRFEALSQELEDT